MDTGRGYFEFGENEGAFLDRLSTLEEKLHAQKRIFSVGEVVKVKESLFRVQRITPKRLILKLLATEPSKEADQHVGSCDHGISYANHCGQCGR